MKKEELIKRGEMIIKASTTYDYCDLRFIANDWQNYGKDRTYFSIVEKSTNASVSKHYKEKKYGYIDNQTGRYYPDKYGDLTKDYTFSGARF